MEKKRHRDDTLEKTSWQRKAIAVVLCIGIFILFLIYPLYYHDGYVGIMDYKSYFINWVLGITNGCCLLICGIYLLMRWRTLTWTNLKRWLREISIGDWCVLFVLLIALVSFISTRDKTEALWARDGRRLGFYMLAACLIAHLFITYCLKSKQLLIFAFLVSISIVNVIAILNNLNIDVLDFYNGQGWSKSLLISTVGNVNSLAGLLSIVLPFAMVGFCLCQQKVSGIIYGLFCFISFMTMVATESDSVYLAIGVIFVVMAGIFLDDWRALRRLLLEIMAFLILTRFSGWLCQTITGEGSTFGGLTAIFGYSNKTLLLLPVLGLLLVVTFWIEKKENVEQLQKIIKKIYFGMIIVGVLVLLILIIGINGMETRELAEQKYHALASFLYFDEMWGSWRGTNFEYTAILFQKESIFHKLFGWAPGNFIGALQTTFNGDVYITGLRMIDAHNDFLDFLINIGILGAIGYYGFLFWNIYQYGRAIKQNKAAASIVCIIVGYIVQGLVNNPGFYTFPAFVLLLAVDKSGDKI